MKKIAVLLGDPRLNDPVKLGGVFNPEDIEVINVLKRALELIPGYNFTFFDDHSTLLEEISTFSSRFDYVLNFCDEGFQNDPKKEAVIPEELEKYDIPYTGADSRCMKLCFNKSEIRKLAIENDIPVAEGFVLSDENPDIIPPFGFPAIIKPVFGDGSFGINEKSVVYDEMQYKKQLEWLRKKLLKFKIKSLILVEEYLPGNEFTVAIIGDAPSFEMRLLEEDFSRLEENMPKIISYRAKWDPAYWSTITSKSVEVSGEAQESAKICSAKIFNAAGCRDYARIDWKLDKHGVPKLLEVNPNCGWVIDGHMAKAFMVGEDQSDLEKCYALNVIKRILEAAEKRFDNEIK